MLVRIEPPGYFSPVPTLTSNQKMGEVIKIFPKPGKFSGTMKEGHLPVADLEKGMANLEK